MSSSPNEWAFKQEMLEDPGNDRPRLAYADWLADIGDSSRSQFIRVQIEVAPYEWLSPYSPIDKKIRLEGSDAREKRKTLRERERTLLRDIRSESISLLTDGANSKTITIDFRRGLIERVIIGDTDSDLLRTAIRNLTKFPEIQFLAINHQSIEDAELQDKLVKSVQSLPFLRVLELGKGQLTPDHIRSLRGLNRLVKLDAHSENDETRLAFREHLTQKTAWYLSLPATRQRSESMVSLPLLTHMSILDDRSRLITNVDMGQCFFDSGNTVLFRACPEIEELSFTDSWITSADLEHLAAMPGLRKLHLFTSEARNVSALRAAPRLEEVIVSESYHTPESDGIRELINNPSLKRLFFGYEPAPDLVAEIKVARPDLEVLDYW